MEPVSAPTPAARARRRPGPLARLDRIPVWPYEKRLLWVVGAGYFFAFFDIVTISFALPVIATQFHTSKGAVSLSVTSSLDRLHHRRAGRQSGGRQVGPQAQPRRLGHRCSPSVPRSPP